MEKIAALKVIADDYDCKMNEMLESFAEDYESGTIKGRIEKHFADHIESILKKNTELINLVNDFILSYDDQEIKEKFNSHKSDCSE